jgi:hypothetical protein
MSAKMRLSLHRQPETQTTVDSGRQRCKPANQQRVLNIILLKSLKLKRRKNYGKAYCKEVSEQE